MLPGGWLIRVAGRPGSTPLPNRDDRRAWGGRLLLAAALMLSGCGRGPPSKQTELLPVPLAMGQCQAMTQAMMAPDQDGVSPGAALRRCMGEQGYAYQPGPGCLPAERADKSNHTPLARCFVFH